MDGSTQAVEGGRTGYAPEQAALLELLRGVDAASYLGRQLPTVLFLSYEARTRRLDLQPAAGSIGHASRGAAIQLMEHIRKRLGSGNFETVAALDRNVIGVVFVGREDAEDERSCPFAALALADGTTDWIWHSSTGAHVVDNAASTRPATVRLTAAMHQLALSAVHARRNIDSPSGSNEPDRGGEKGDDALRSADPAA